MDHYTVLGVSKHASKEEIKQAFRKLAMEFHPDKHSQSSQHLRDSATLKFQRLSEAYETLIDDRKRTDYNLARNSSYTAQTQSRGYAQTQSRAYDHHHRYGSGSGSGYAYEYGYKYGYVYSGAARRGSGDWFVRMESLRYLRTRSFLLSATLFGILIGGTYIVEEGGKALRKMRNPGKSLKEALESIEKAKAIEDDSN